MYRKCALLVLLYLSCAMCAGVRVKRARYYSSLPPGTRFPYRRPPYTSGVISYTPPPGYIDTEGPSPAGLTPSNAKPSRPEDSDINNFISSLSKDDLEMLLQLMKDKPTDTGANYGTSSKKYKHIYNRPKDNLYSRPLVSTGNSSPNGVRPVQSLQDLEGLMSAIDESLPRPVNLREDPYEISFSKPRPSYARPSALSTYKLESVKDLPLSEYKSGTKQLNSYSVPHYSVTSGESSVAGGGGAGAGAGAGAGEEYSPSGGESKLKAVGIWTHKSRGASYTLHEDGTLTVETR